MLPFKPSPDTDALGIFQSDLILRSAIMLGIADLRVNPFLLDFCFASLPRDVATAKAYGIAELNRAKEYFLQTDFPVCINMKVGDVKLPCISIALNISAEDEQTLGDVHYKPYEPNDSQWTALAGPFDPVSYSVSTGKLVIPEQKLILAPGQLIVDKYGKTYTITEVDDQSTVYIDKFIITDLTGLVIKGNRPNYSVALESLNHRESYEIGCHVQSEPVHLIYLHSVLIFILNRYKEIYLEARGLERTVTSSSDLTKNSYFENEIVFSRFTTLTGYVRQCWPKAINPNFVAVETDIQASAVGDDISSVVVDVSNGTDLDEDETDFFGSK